MDPDQAHNPAPTSIPKPAPNPGSTPTGMADNTRKRLLLVEDEAIIALGEKRSLERYGYEVLSVTNGQKAIELCRVDPKIDLILMDIDLGHGMDGTEAARVILQDQDIPIVFLSSHTEPDFVVRTEAITSYGYVVKNSSITVLDASIKMAFKLFQANQQTLALNKKLEATLDALPELLFEVDLAGRYWDAHYPDASLLYKPVEELLGCRISDRLPEPAATIIMAAIAEANQKGLAGGRQYELPMPPGTRWFELTVSRMASQHEIPHFILFCQDITDRIRMVQALMESDRRFRALADIAPVHIWECDANNVCTYVNTYRTRFTGRTFEEEMGKGWQETIHPDDRNACKAISEKGFASREKYQNEYRLRKFDGTYALILDQATPRFADSGEFLGYIGVCTEISDRIQPEPLEGIHYAEQDA
jgi:PAS domain S-box-containing protein